MRASRVVRTASVVPSAVRRNTGATASWIVWVRSWRPDSLIRESVAAGRADGQRCRGAVYISPHAMKLTLGISPCPNDTFIFDALANGGLPTGDLRFDVVLEDVQTLNDWARAGRLDVSKVSYGVVPAILSEYAVLSAGGALGRGVGPLLVARPGAGPLRPERATVAIPGRDTTAHL